MPTEDAIYMACVALAAASYEVLKNHNYKNS